MIIVVPIMLIMVYIILLLLIIYPSTSGDGGLTSSQPRDGTRLAATAHGARGGDAGATEDQRLTVALGGVFLGSTKP